MRNINAIHYNFFVYLFFLLMLVTPTTLQKERGAILILIIAFTVIKIIKNPSNSWKIHKDILIWLLLCLGVSFFSLYHGVVNNNPGAIPQITVFILWPILFVYFIGLVKKINIYVYLLKTLIIGISVATISQLIFVISQFLGISIFSSFYELQGGIVGFYDGMTRFTLFNMTTTIYGLPFLTAIIISQRIYSFLPRFWYKIVVVATFISLASLLLSGRRAFLLTFLISVPLSFFLLKTYGAKINRTMVRIFHLSIYAFMVFMFLFYYFDLSIDDVLERQISGYQFSEVNDSTVRRKEQFYVLINDWLKSPLIGYGMGAVGSDNIGASLEDVPWGYELYYLALLFQTGLLGIVIYGGSIFWLNYKMVVISRKNANYAALFFPLQVALICFLIANATNPYLGKFDYLWTIFLPLGLVNYAMSNRQ